VVARNPGATTSTGWCPAAVSMPRPTVCCGWRWHRRGR